MIRLMLSAFQSTMPAQLNVNQIMSPSENFLKYALEDGNATLTRICAAEMAVLCAALSACRKVHP